MKSYEEYMKKAHGALILERENEIIMELRATRDFLTSEIRDSKEELHTRIDGLEKKIDEVISLLKRSK